MDITNLNSVLSHVTVNSQVPLLQAHPHLKQFVRPAVDKAITELLTPIVDRSVKYTVNACESLIKKDFALDPDENRMKHGAHHMMRYLTAGMAMITSRDHIFVAVSGNLKASFTAALRGNNTSVVSICFLIFRVSSIKFNSINFSSIYYF